MQSLPISVSPALNLTDLETVDQFAISYLVLTTLTTSYNDWTKVVTQRYSDFVDVSMHRYVLAIALSSVVKNLACDITADHLDRQQMVQPFTFMCVRSDFHKCLQHLNTWKRLIQSESIEIKLMYVKCLQC
jgi:hypothetical protein